MTIAEQLREEVRVDMAKEMLLDYKPIDEVVKYAKLPLERVYEIKQEIESRN